MYLNVFKCLINHNRLLGALVVMSGTIMGSCMFCSFCLLHCWPTLVFLPLPCRLSKAFLKVLTVSTLFTMLGREFHGSVTLTDQKFLLISPFPCFGITLRCPVVCLVDASPSLGWQNWNQVAGETLSLPERTL